MFRGLTGISRCWVRRPVSIAILMCRLLVWVTSLYRLMVVMVALSLRLQTIKQRTLLLFLLTTLWCNLRYWVLFISKFDYIYIYTYIYIYIYIYSWVTSKLSCCPKFTHPCILYRHLTYPFTTVLHARSFPTSCKTENETSVSKHSKHRDCSLNIRI